MVLAVLCIVAGLVALIFVKPTYRIEYPHNSNAGALAIALLSMLLIGLGVYLFAAALNFWGA